MLLTLLNKASASPPVGFVLSARVAVLKARYSRASWPFKDPDEVLDYDIDWTQRLYSEAELEQFNAGVEVEPADSIASSVFTVPTGIVMTSSSRADTATKVWLSGGTEGRTYLIQNRIITDGGRTMDQTVKLKVKSK